MPIVAELLVIVTALLSAVVNPPTRLAAARAQYLEDDAGGRPVAELRVAVFGGRDGARVALRIAAVAPDVAPAFGGDGLAGANLVTARELALLEADGTLRFEMRPLTSGAVRSGVLERGRVPLMTFAAADGRPAPGLGPDDLPLAWLAVSPPLGPGPHSLVAVARGAPRLTVDVTLAADGTATIDAITSRGAPLPQPPFPDRDR